MTLPQWASSIRKGSSELDSLLARPIIHIAYFAGSFLILFSRRPDAILNPQFYAEDGTYWYADAYHFGFRCLFIPEAGYLLTVPRLLALFTPFFPFSFLPFFIIFFPL